jgi:hypothetical protein
MNEDIELHELELYRFLLIVQAGIDAGQQREEVAAAVEANE